MWSTKRLRDAATILMLSGINETEVGVQRETNTCRETMCLQYSLGRPGRAEARKQEKPPGPWDTSVHVRERMAWMQGRLC